MANPTSSDDEPVYMRALNAARNGDKAALEGRDGELLASARDALWRKVEGNPNYLLNRHEFALFNYYRQHYEKIAKNKETTFRVGQVIARFIVAFYRHRTPSNMTLCCYHCPPGSPTHSRISAIAPRSADPLKAMDLYEQLKHNERLNSCIMCLIFSVSDRLW
ncbi:uncharacterized protein BDV14DRAFT_183921 [Aspergillus stella-maris]|uniref:uncharacterized protein n=1 Tax=Aspergillus stella-maris TaxID=1810926 RepID=UPI003CCE1B27